MIVRDAERDLRLCLESARPAVDQVVIADTGSTDRSREIAAEYGATLVNFPWTDHFAEARNAALEPVTTDWVLVLDADEELTPEAPRTIRSLLRASQGVGGYQVTIRNYIPDRFAMTFEGMSRVNHDRVPRAAQAPAYTEHRMVRLFRRHPQIRFARRVHEGVDEAIRSLGLRIGQANFLIRHFGHLARETDREKKRQYYLDLGRRKTAEHPEDALGWLELGSEYFNAENYAEALACMRRCFALQPWALAALYIARIEAIEGHSSKALATLEMVPDHRDLALLRHELRGDLLHDLRRFPEGRLAYQTALRFSPRGGVRTPAGARPTSKASWAISKCVWGWSESDCESCGRRSSRCRTSSTITIAW
jgi:glycosyltransferase involved in cell wall biosynthesis